MLVSAVHLLSQGSGKPIYKSDFSQRTFQEIKREIASYEDVAKAIIDLAVYGKYQNRSYERLGLLVDTVGPRLSGSKNLEKAIQIMYQNLQHDGLENVHLEPVKIPHWERGEESAVMLLPRIHKMSILGLGSSVATPPGGCSPSLHAVTPRLSSEYGLNIINLTESTPLEGGVQCWPMGVSQGSIMELL
ncbi:carboxypeptidase Q [Cricetulus griseus]